MRLTAAFFANHAEVVNDMLNVEGGFWKTTTVAPNSAGFRCYTVVLCDDGRRRRRPTVLDAHRRRGPHRTPPDARALDRSSPSTAPTMFMCFTSMVLPIDPGGGRHLYTFRLGGQHERVDVPLPYAWRVA